MALMEEDPGQPEDEVALLRREIADKDEEIADMKSRLETVKPSDIEEDLDKAQKLIEQERNRGEDYLARLTYLQADFENYRKRIDREMRDVEDFSTSSLVRKLLPVLDDLDLAIATAGKDASGGIVEGITMVQKNMMSTLQGEGLREIEAVGQPFDPEIHEAVERVDGTENKRDMVVAEIRKGYIFKDKVLRPSMVRVESAVKQ